MRLISTMIVIAIALSILSPPGVVTLQTGSASATIQTLDVCHSATPALSSNGDIPCVNECPCNHIPSLVVAFTEQSKPFFLQFLIPLPVEQPPRA